MIGHVGAPQCRFRLRDCLLELTELGMTPGEKYLGEDPNRTAGDAASAIFAAVTLKGVDATRERLSALAVVPAAEQHLAQAMVGQRLNADVLKLDGEGKGTLAGVDGPGVGAEHPARCAERRKSPCHPALITNRARKLF